MWGSRAGAGSRAAAGTARATVAGRHVEEGLSAVAVTLIPAQLREQELPLRCANTGLDLARNEDGLPSMGAPPASAADAPVGGWRAITVAAEVAVLPVGGVVIGAQACWQRRLVSIAVCGGRWLCTSTIIAGRVSTSAA